jgi:hypothetical protein
LAPFAEEQGKSPEASQRGPQPPPKKNNFGLKHTIELSGGIFEKLLDIGGSRVENEFARAEN